MTLQSPGLPSLFFLFYILLALPYAAMRSARRLRDLEAQGGAAALPKPEVVWLNTIVMLIALFALAWLVGKSFGYEVFAVPKPLGGTAWLAAAGALAACFAVRVVARRLRPPGERRHLAVFKLAPRTKGQWALWAITIVCAGIAEEAAYRGVGMSILWYSLGNPWVAVLICAAGFGAAHAVQGRRSMVAIVAIALVMHALVAITGTLVLAMLVHAVYDFVAGFLIAREAKSMGLLDPA